MHRSFFLRVSCYGMWLLPSHVRQMDKVYAFNPGTGPLKQHDTDLTDCSTALDWLSNVECVQGLQHFIQHMIALDGSRLTAGGFFRDDAPDHRVGKIQVHHIIGDKISMLNTSSWTTRNRAWSPREVPLTPFHCPSMYQFPKPEWTKVMEDGCTEISLS